MRVVACVCRIELIDKHEAAVEKLKADCTELKNSIDKRCAEATHIMNDSFQERYNKLEEFKNLLKDHVARCEKTLAEFERKFRCDWLLRRSEVISLANSI